MTLRRLAPGAILMLYAVLAVAYALTVPLFEASDEAEHFIYMHTILETGELPVIQSREQMNAQTDPVLRWNNQSHHAPLYYLLGSALVSWSDRADLADYLIPNELIFLRDTTENNPNKWLHRYTEPRSDTHLALYTLRLVNVLIGAGTLMLVYLTARHLTGRDSLALAAALLIAVLPTFIVVHSSVSNDPLVIFLYSAGLLWTVRVWQAQNITARDTALLALILAGIALTKLTGVSLFGVVYLALLTGAFWGRWSWRSAAQTIAITAGVIILLAGWWYWRNLTLYGDLLAQEATASIWGRSSAFDLATLPDDLLRIYKSFWMMVGYLHQPVFAPDGFYVYLTVITLAGIGGLIWQLSRKWETIYLWPLLAFFVLFAMLIYGTTSVDISYGRLLLPAAAGFAPLLMLGWWRLLGRWSPLLILPLAGLAIYAPLALLPQAYPTLHPVTEADIPAQAIPLRWQSGNLEMLAVDWHTPQPDMILPGQPLQVDLYMRGNHPDNPALLVTAVDSVRTARLAHLEVYPGMAATAFLPDEQIWRVPLRLELAPVDAGLAPRVVMLLFEWVNLEDNTSLVYGDGQTLLDLPGPALYEPDYQVAGGEVLTTFRSDSDESILLRGTDIPAEAAAGDTIRPALIWETPQTPSYDWTLTLQLFDENGELAAQSDGALWWYPTRRWVPKTTFEDMRDLVLSDDLPAGTYTLRAGWYRQLADDTFTRMSSDHPQAIDGLVPLATITVR